HIAPAARGSHRRPGGALRQLEIGLIELRDRLVDLNAVTHIDEARHDLAWHAKAKRAFDPWPYDPGIGKRAPPVRELDNSDLYGAHALLLHVSFILAARGEGGEAHDGHQSGGATPSPSPSGGDRR